MCKMFMSNFLRIQHTKNWIKIGQFLTELLKNKKVDVFETQCTWGKVMSQTLWSRHDCHCVGIIWRNVCEGESED